MYRTIRPAIDVQVIDLVLDPLAYRDALRAPLTQGRLDDDAINHLAKVLPAAVAQLDAIGDEYGTLALAGLFHQLTHDETAV